MSYVSINPASTLVSGFSFAPTSCRLDEDECATDGTCTNKNSFTLFDSSLSTCSNAEKIGFDISYDDSNTKWNFQFMLFLFNPNEINSYKLKCSLQVCKDDQDPSSACNTMASKCLPADNPFYTPCGEGTSWDTASTSCKDEGYSLPQPTTMYASLENYDSIHIFEYVDHPDSTTWLNSWPNVKTIRNIFSDMNTDTGKAVIVWNEEQQKLEWFKDGQGYHAIIDPATETFTETELPFTVFDYDSAVYTPEVGTLYFRHQEPVVINITPRYGQEPRTDISYPTQYWDGGEMRYHDGKIFLAPGPNKVFQIYHFATNEWEQIPGEFAGSGMARMTFFQNNWYFFSYYQRHVLSFNGDHSVDNPSYSVRKLTNDSVGQNFRDMSFSWQYGDQLLTWYGTETNRVSARRFDANGNEIDEGNSVIDWSVSLSFAGPPNENGKISAVFV